MLMVKPPPLFLAANLDGDAPFATEPQLCSRRQRAIGLAEKRPSQVFDVII
jgi:hypothetical protein